MDCSLANSTINWVRVSRSVYFSPFATSTKNLQNNEAGFPHVNDLTARQLAPDPFSLLSHKQPWWFLVVPIKTCVSLEFGAHLKKAILFLMVSEPVFLACCMALDDAPASSISFSACAYIAIQNTSWWQLDVPLESETGRLVPFSLTLALYLKW